MAHAEYANGFAQQQELFDQFSTVIPEQFYDPPYPDSPVRKLLLAVFDNGIATARGQLYPHKSKTATLEAQAWVNNNDTTWLYSFLNCCLILDLDPNTIRSLIKGTWKKFPPRLRPRREKPSGLLEA
jgi:hypothetical protein